MKRCVQRPNPGKSDKQLRHWFPFELRSIFRPRLPRGRSLVSAAARDEGEEELHRHHEGGLRAEASAGGAIAEGQGVQVGKPNKIIKAGKWVARIRSFFPLQG